MLVDEPGDAAHNMAVDGALLQLAQAPTLRIYGWQPHAVSLGYFQSLADFSDLPDDTVFVRRATGGGAIHHGDELTFSLALDATRLPGDIASSYTLLHDAIVRALAQVGVTCHRQESGKQPAARPSDRWCFRTPVAGDLVTNDGKLLGSAQRRARVVTGATERDRVLHHGSLVIERPDHTPFVAAVADQVTPTGKLRRELREVLVAELAKVLRLDAHDDVRSRAEDTMAAQLAAEQFGNPSYLRRK